MFSISVIDSDAFLAMPLSTQALYFHLAMRADDDGFVNNPKRIMRTIGANDGDIEPLINKRYIICFESGVIVIKHWRMHNYIQNDRYHKTNYQEEFKQLVVKDNKAYTEQKKSNLLTVIEPCIQGVSNMDTECIQDVSSLEAEIRLDKIRLDKSSKDNMSDAPASECVDIIKKRFHEFWNEYPKKTGKGLAEKSFIKIKPTESLFSEIMSALSKAKKCQQWKRDNGQFIPYPATWLNQKRWEDDYDGEETQRTGFSNTGGNTNDFNAGGIAL
jgi:hypothetical protein